jgi:hypothetical protein
MKTKTKMKTTLFLSMLTIAIGFTACTKDSPKPTIITATITELDATAETVTNTQFGLVCTGPFTKFSFSEGGEVQGDNWDIAFRNSKIIVNGGTDSDTSQPSRTGNAAAYKIDGLMAEISSVNVDLLKQDGSNTSMYGTTAIIDDQGQAGLGWSLYNNDIPQAPILEPLAGKIFVFRTHDDKYAKVEILNFYDNPMTNPYGGYYTFNYVYQADGTTTF